VRIEKVGERLGSPYPERRRLKIVVDTDIDRAIDTLRTIRKFDGEPWWRSSTCPYCEKRKEYEGKTPNAWKRELCMRHYLVEHLLELVDYFVVDNKPSLLATSNGSIEFKVCSNNYDYHITITDNFAELRVKYKGTQYVFRYNNHKNATPYLSAYQCIVNAIAEAIEELVEVLRIAKSKMATWFNLEVITPTEHLFIPARTAEE